VVKCGKYGLAKFANFVYFCIVCGNCYHFRPKCGSNFRTQYKLKVYKICELCKAIFSVFYNISQPNFAVFTHFSIIFPGIYIFCQDKKLVYNGNCLFSVNGRVRLQERRETNYSSTDHLTAIGKPTLHSIVLRKTSINTDCSKLTLCLDVF
jgi:hypothetical protein